MAFTDLVVSKSVIMIVVTYNSRVYSLMIPVWYVSQPDRIAIVTELMKYDCKKYFKTVGRNLSAAQKMKVRA